MKIQTLNLLIFKDDTESERGSDDRSICVGRSQDKYPSAPGISQKSLDDETAHKNDLTRRAKQEEKRVSKSNVQNGTRQDEPPMGSISQ